MAKMQGNQRRWYDHPDDKGANGRNFEVDARLKATPKTKVLRAQGAGKRDHTIRIDAKTVSIEYKTNCGTVTDTFATPIFNDIDLNDKATLAPYIAPKATIIVYAVNVGTDYDVLTDSYVFTREQFIDFLFSYGRPLVRRNSKKSGSDYCLNINTYNNSEKKLNYFLNEAYKQPTYGEWLSELGRI